MSNKKSFREALDRAELNPIGTIPDAARNANLAVIKSQLVKPREALTPERVEQMAAEGLSRHVICGLLGVHFTTIVNDPLLEAAFNKGRSEIGSKVRAKLVEDALYNDSMPAKLYLDKIMGGDIEQKALAVTVTQSPLENVSTEKLLEIDDGQDSDD